LITKKATEELNMNREIVRQISTKCLHKMVLEGLRHEKGEKGNNSWLEGG
jgi:hypothetical protein